MRATIKITKSFEGPVEYSKKYEKGDFKEFLEEEGDYCDKLAKALKEQGKQYQDWEIVYTVKLVKEEG